MPKLFFDSPGTIFGFLGLSQDVSCAGGLDFSALVWIFYSKYIGFYSHMVSVIN